MKTDALWKISVLTSPEAEEAVLNLLAEIFDVPASVYADAETLETFVIVYLEKKSAWSAVSRAQIVAGLQRIEDCGLDVRPGKILAKRIRREDWAESWKRHFKPMEIGTRLLIQPSWSKRRPKKNQVLMILDPGLSFGTGHHPTTRFCLEQLAAFREASKSQSFLDIGTGSGILAIAAAKLGYKPVEAFDFDPEAVRVARANAQQNEVQRKLRLSRQDLSKLPLRGECKYDIVCANLIYDLLLTERQRILNRLSADGVLVLAGILRTQFAEVQKAYEKSGLKLRERQTEKEWESGAFVRAR